MVEEDNRTNLDRGYRLPSAATIRAALPAKAAPNWGYWAKALNAAIR